MKIQIETISPLRAKTLLEEGGQGNRPISPSNLNFLYSQINENRWRLTGDTIKLSHKDKDGKRKILDGQHRLRASADMNMPIDVAIAYDVDEDSFQYIDIGKKRTAQDTLSIYFQDKDIYIPRQLVTIIATTIKIVWHLENPGGYNDIPVGTKKLYGMYAITNEDTVINFEKNKIVIMKLVDKIFKEKTGIQKKANVFASAIMLLRKGEPETLVESFFHKLWTGISATESIVSVRDYLCLQTNENKGNSQRWVDGYAEESILAYLLTRKAFFLYKEKKKMQVKYMIKILKQEYPLLNKGVK